MNIRIGFIGVGGIAADHIQALQRIEHAKVTSVYNINHSKAREAADKYGVIAYDSAEQLIDSGNVDALFITTPPYVRDHTPIEEMAAAKGIHLLAEKPVGLQLEQAILKEKAILASGIIHSSGYVLRYLDIVQRAKQYLADKQIDLITARRYSGIPSNSWWAKMELSGGQLVEMSTHQLDLIRYLAGEFIEVHAIHEQRSIHKEKSEASVYDVGTVSFVMESGAIGNITSTCLAKLRGRNDIEFIGEGFQLSIEGATLRIIDEKRDNTYTSQDDVMYLQNAAFVEAIRQGKQELVLGSYSEAVKTLAVSLAANQSAAEKRSVALTNP